MPPTPVSRTMISDQPEPTGLIKPDYANGINSFTSQPSSTTEKIQQPPQRGNGPLLSSIDSKPLTSATLSAPPTAALPLPNTQRTLSMPASAGQDSTVMNETLHVIDEHITHLNTPRSSVQKQSAAADDSASEYSSYKESNRLSYINGEETDEEEQTEVTQSEVLSWNAAQVASYLAEIGVDKRHCDVFRDQEISGEVLLELDQESIFLKEFDLGPVGRRLRTWHKIKSLQQDLRNSGMSGSVHDFANTETQAKLPKIPSLNDNQSVQTITRQLSYRAASQPHSSPSDKRPSNRNTDTSSPIEAIKPSSATTRSFGHSKRHSSVDVRRSISSQISHDSINVGIGRLHSGPHKKQPSFDRSWTMTPAQSVPIGSGPSSATFSLYANSDKVPSPAKASDQTNPQLPSPDLDRGYFSGGEIDARKGRKVLRKKDDVSHSRNSSVSREVRRKSLLPLTTKQHGRVGSVDSMHDMAPRRIAPAAKAYFSDSRRSRRAASGPEFTKSAHQSQESTLNSPALAKLDYGDPLSIDAVAASPKIAESESSSLGQSTPSATQNSSITSRIRNLGLKSLTDAIGGNEKSTLTASSELIASPNKGSPAQSPLTGSSTLPATSKGAEADKSVIAKPETKVISPNLQKSTADTRRKSKKYPSSNVRGLEKISPKERRKDCDFSGWMKKRSSNLMTTWKPRLFVLNGSRLSYYYSEDDTEEKGLIDISSHKVLPANSERITGLHASLTGVSSPTSPTVLRTASGSPASPSSPDEASTKMGPNGVFIFKLVPPRSGLSRAVNFAKPTIHYFAVESIELGRLWMAALMKVTISRDESTPVVTTYQQKTMSLAQARVTRQRPPALMNLDEESTSSSPNDDVNSWGLAIHGLNRDKKTLSDQEAEGPGKSPTKYPESPLGTRTELTSNNVHLHQPDSMRQNAKKNSSNSPNKFSAQNNVNEYTPTSTASSSIHDDNSIRVSSVSHRRDTVSGGVTGSPPASTTDSIGSSFAPAAAEGTSDYSGAKYRIGKADSYSHEHHRTCSEESEWSAKYKIR